MRVTRRMVTPARKAHGKQTRRKLPRRKSVRARKHRRSLAK